jgi:hypothetical protein
VRLDDRAVEPRVDAADVGEDGRHLSGAVVRLP